MIGEPATERSFVRRVLAPARLPQTVLAVALFATLLVPATREVHVLIVRMLFHLNGRTIVEGQPAGCVLYNIPHVILREDQRRRIAAESDRSPEAFALAVATGARRPAVPPVSAWQGHPMLSWAALQATLPVCDEYRDPGEPAPSSRVALELVRAAQAEEPHNGLLWLAEAAILFYDEQPDDAVEALRTCAEKPQWDAKGEEADRFLAEQLAAQGMPELDAYIEARDRLTFHDVARYAAKQLAEQMASAISEGRDGRVVDLLSTQQGLSHARCKNHELYNLFRRPLADDDLLAAAAQYLSARGDRRWADVKPADLDESQRTLLLRSYMKAIGCERLYIELKEGERLLRKDWESARDTKDVVTQAMLWAALFARSSAALTAFAMTTGVVVLLAGAFRLVSPGAGSKHRPAASRWVLCGAVGTAVAVLSALLIFSLQYATAQPVGLRAGPPRWGETASGHATGAVAAAVAWAVLAALWARGRLWRFYPSLLVLIGYTYTACVIATGYFRWEFLSILREAPPW